MENFFHFIGTLRCNFLLCCKRFLPVLLKICQKPKDLSASSVNDAMTSVDAACMLHQAMGPLLLVGHMVDKKRVEGAVRILEMEISLVM